MGKKGRIGWVNQHAASVNSTIFQRPRPVTLHMTLSRLAIALAKDYEYVYYLSTKDDSYVQYSAYPDGRRLYVLSRGTDFFADTVVNCRKLVYLEDQENFLHTFNKKNLYETLRREGSFTLDYRLVINGVPRYYQLATAVDATSEVKYIVIGVRNVDTQMRRKMAEDEEHAVYSQIALSLAARYEVIYYVNIDTNEYREFGTSEKYTKLEKGEQGKDFFEEAKVNMIQSIFAEDYPMMRDAMVKETFLKSLRERGSYSLTYRLILDDQPQYVNLRAVFPENDPHHIIIAVANIDNAKRRELEIRQALGSAVSQANRDALTGVKNKYAYVHAEEELNSCIGAGGPATFAVAVFDVNELKMVNDTQGHIAGDAYIRSACRMICTVFKHSPVYRIGGDEFAVIMQGHDYQNADVLMSTLKANVLSNKESGLVTIAAGMSVFRPGEDSHVEDVFNRADAAMYENKKQLKGAPVRCKQYSAVKVRTR